MLLKTCNNNKSSKNKLFDGRITLQPCFTVARSLAHYWTNFLKSRLKTSYSLKQHYVVILSCSKAYTVYTVSYFEGF